MRIQIKSFLVLLLTVASFAAAPAVFADEVPLSGTVYWVNPGSSEIWIQEGDENIVEIIGFPFHNLEVQLEAELGETVTIAEGDCVAINYYEKRNERNKWSSLTMYCPACSGCLVDDGDNQWHCDDAETDACFKDEDGLTRNPQCNSRPDPPAGPWNGNPPGFSHRP